MKLLTKSTDRNASLGIVERFAYMSGSFGTVFVYTIIGTYLLYYYTDIIGLSGTIVGTILLVSRILDGISDFLMGAIVGRTRSKHGRTRAWILWSCVPYAISGVLVVSVPVSAPEIVQYIFVAITYNLCCTVAYTAMTVPYNAFICNITANTKEHGILGVFSMLGGTISGLVVQSTITGLTGSLGGDARAWQIAGVVYAALSLVFHLLCFAGTKERCVEERTPAQGKSNIALKDEVMSLVKNQYWIYSVIICFAALLVSGVMQAAGMYYANAVFGDTAYFMPVANAMSIGLVFGVFLAAALMGRLGKRNTMLIGAVTSAAVSLLMGIFASSITAATIFSAIRGFMYGQLTACVYGMVADTIDYGEWKSGIKAEGLGLAGVTIGTKLATGLSSVFVGMLIDMSGYDAALPVQPASAVTMTTFCLCYFPAILGLVMIACLAAYKLDKIYPDIQKELEARRNQSGSR